ncbi:FecR family protein [Membranihabitans marinus]|uniref:FecR family protein n=1 Tax=Membranihabitans marinus TaxID=1227546 RepID=UPI001F178372|nr:FecR family protein [Membranihabitans marinus]
MNKANFSNLLKKYLTRKASEGEKELLEKFYSEIQNENIGWEDWSSEEKTALEARMRSKIKAKIQPRPSIFRMQSFWKMTAALALLLITAYLVIDTIKPISSVQSLSQIVVSKAINASKSVLLSDGSYVLLQKGSSIKYPLYFDKSNRQVELTGEAWFDVQRDTLRPFSVQSNDITTTVLGTSFSIKAHANESNIEVKVTSGKVSVKNVDQELSVLVKDEELLYNTETKDFTKKKIEKLATEANNVERNEFQLLNVTMAEAVDFLNKRWEKIIVIENEEIKDCRLVASFYQEDSLEDILTIICGVSNSRYSYKDNQIVINGTGCK